MTYRFCHRCQAELLPHDEGTLIFCSHCGAPQVVLSEELKTQMETEAAALADPGTNSVAAAPRSQVWAVALRCVALAAAIAAGLSLLALATPPAILLAWLWAVISPVVVIGLFQARSPLTPMTTGFGARLGLVTGLGIAAAMSVVNTASLVIARRMHWMGDFDSRMNAAIDQMKMQIAAQPGVTALPVSQALALPEFRAGMLLAGTAVLIAMLLVLTTAGGAFAGFVRMQKRA